MPDTYRRQTSCLKGAVPKTKQKQKERLDWSVNSPLDYHWSDPSTSYAFQCFVMIFCPLTVVTTPSAQILIPDLRTVAEIILPLQPSACFHDGVL